MTPQAHDWKLRMSLEIRFRGMAKEEVFWLFSEWWRQQGRAHDIRAAEITVLSKTEIPPPVENAQDDEDLL